MSVYVNMYTWEEMCVQHMKHTWICVTACVSVHLIVGQRELENVQGGLKLDCLGSNPGSTNHQITSRLTFLTYRVGLKIASTQGCSED